MTDAAGLIDARATLRGCWQCQEAALSETDALRDAVEEAASKERPLRRQLQQAESEKATLAASLEAEKEKTKAAEARVAQAESAAADALAEGRRAAEGASEVRGRDV